MLYTVTHCTTGKLTYVIDKTISTQSINNCTHRKLWNVITHPYLNISGDLTTPPLMLEMGGWWHHTETTRYNHLSAQISDENSIEMMTSSNGNIFRVTVPFCAGNSPVNSTHKDQWRGTLMFSYICAWINGWVNNPEADVLSCHRAHYDVIVMTKEDPDGTPYLNHMAAVRWDVISMPHCTIRMLACLVDNTISAQGFRSSLMEIAHCGKRDISLICIKYNSIYYRCCGLICILTPSTKRIVYLSLLQSCAIIFFNVKYLQKTYPFGLSYLSYLHFGISCVVHWLRNSRICRIPQDYIIVTEAINRLPPSQQSSLDEYGQIHHMIPVWIDNINTTMHIYICACLMWCTLYRWVSARKT